MGVVSFASSDAQVIRKLLSYVRSVVSFAMVAKKYRFKYYPDRNFPCWLHHDHNPSAKVRNKGGREVYTCYTGCGYGDVIWLIQQVEEIKSVAHVIEFMNTTFGLNLEDKLSEILGVKTELTDLQKCYQVHREFTDCVTGAVYQSWKGLNEVSRMQLFGDREFVWMVKDEIDAQLIQGITENECTKLLQKWRDLCIVFLHKVERIKESNLGVTIPQIFGEPNA